MIFKIRFYKTGTNSVDSKTAYDFIDLSEEIIAFVGFDGAGSANCAKAT